MSILTDLGPGIPISASGITLTASKRRRPPIGLSGYAGTGKTAAALLIEAEHGYRRQHIAEPLRRMLASLLKDFGYSDRNIARILTGDLKDGWVIPEIGRTSRDLQITLGTEWGREQVGQDLWAKLWMLQANRAGGAVMNDSVRFRNEEDAIRDAGGFTILIQRPGAQPRAFKWKRLGPLLYRCCGLMWGVHDSERVDRLRPDHVVVNDGTLADLHDKLEAIILSH
jgi:hypothetical protein